MFLPPADALSFFPEYRSTQTPWQGLTPVAAWAVAAIRPPRLVELGTYRGDSFLAFVQASRGVDAVRDLCAVDTWAGDIHTGEYGEGVYRQFTDALARREDPRARFLRTTFSGAAGTFEDGSIDLLHIDGAHDYASVREDFETWLPRMTADGVVLLHDTMVRREPYAVWRLWEEIVAAYPGRTYNFTFSNGLGVLCLGTGTDHDFQQLTDLAPADRARIDRAMALAGRRVLATTEFEAGLVAADGAPLSDAHLFATGDALRGVALLMQSAEIDLAAAAHRALEPLRDDGTAPLDAALGTHVRAILSDRVDDLFAALEPKLAAYVGESFAQRTGTRLSGQAGDGAAALGPDLAAQIRAALAAGADDLFAALEPKLAAYVGESFERRIETLLTEQAGDVAAALGPDLAAQVRAALAAGVDDLFTALEPKLAAYVNATFDRRIERLLSQQAGDVFAALEPQIAAYVTAREAQ